MMESELLRFWAKTSHDHESFPNAFHPLICHMLDVAAVTRSMWKNVLSNAVKKRINGAFGVKDAENLVAFIAGLHDLGKCSPPFALRGLGFETNKASLVHSLRNRKESKSFISDRIHGRLQSIRLLELYRHTDLWIPGVKKAGEVPHGYVTAVELPVILSERYGFGKRSSKEIATLIGGHHGVFPTSSEILRISRWGEPSIGGTSWSNARIGLSSELARLFNPLPIPQDTKLKLDNGTIMILSGLVSVADWIGSDTEFFESAAEYPEAAKSKQLEIRFKFRDFETYLEHAEEQASVALLRLGWVHKKNDSGVKNPLAELEDERRFKELFPVISNLRHLQNMAIEISKELNKPGIAVIEAPTGEGKTEAAMFLADAWNSRLDQTGYYFALPTQATSNQMFGRAKDFLENRFPGTNVNVQLTHGHASLSGEFETLKDEHRNILKGIYDDQCEGDECAPTVVAAEWFTYRKRGLLTPFGVGTVDQALMSVLQTRHVFVRLFGLAHKTVIIDEVHAYDAYMSTLLERLLEWLAALGSPVILLSATLPIERRNRLIKAYQQGLGVETKEIQTADYPRISFATDSVIKIRHIETSEKRRTLNLKNVDENYAYVLKAKLMKEGGCVAIICNTVQRAQDTFDELSKDAFFGDKLDLLHARFRYIDREKREERVLKRFGKPDKNGESPHRPKCAILIATQIIEQSLDIDFDLMISDLAPIDLLLQRAGRLQRHHRARNYEFKLPTLWINQARTKDDGLPNFDNSIVYDEHILLRTWLTLQQKVRIEIPDGVENLIEAIYDTSSVFMDLDEKLQEYWQASLDKWKKANDDDDEKAKDRIIKRPIYSDHISGIFASNLEEDSPEIHKTLQAVTRLTEPSTNVVCLWEKDRKIFLDEDFATEINLDEKPNTDLTKELLRRSVGVSKKSVVFQLLAEKASPSWQKSSLLCHHRLLKFNENRKCEGFGHVFCLDEQLGLTITELEENRKRV